jgi:hypothetical protein
VYYLYGSKGSVPRRLVATFDSEPQLLAYVRWATLGVRDNKYRFEQGSALASFESWSYATSPLNDNDAQSVVHNPSPSML